MKITIISVGKAHDTQIALLINDYERRLKGFGVTISWQIIPSQNRSNEPTQKSAETENILKVIGKNDFVVLLDENGKQFNNQQLADTLEDLRDRSQDVSIIIGGAYGVDDKLYQRAQLTWSLSELVFPHQLVRLVLAEQLYRTFAIINGSKYHH